MTIRLTRIAVILPLEMEYSGRLLTGAMDYVREHGGVTLSDIPYSLNQPARLRLPVPLPFDAAFTWATREAHWVEKLLAAGVPVISASGDWPVERVPCVSFDPLGLVRVAVDHLARLRPAALLNLQFQITGVPQVENRCRLFEKAAADRGIPATCAEVFRPGDGENLAMAIHSPLAARPARRLARLLQDVPKPAAVWCHSDHLACRVCEAAEELGLRIPEDLAVLGTGDFKAAECCRPSLSSVPLPGEQVGYLALKTLDEARAAGTGIPSYVRVQPPPVVVRASTVRQAPRGLLEKALELIAARACEGITVGEVAAALDCSPQTLHARFVRDRGHPPGEEIRRTRLAAAKRYLMDDRLGIARVADLCGFSQHSKFTDFFRRHTGRSPRQWRREHR